ncbi:MAG: hypothetical protein ACHRHE_13440 [Tepidisphaerales bacterium]
MKSLTLCLAMGTLAAVTGCKRPGNPQAPTPSRPGAPAHADTQPSAAISRKILQLGPYPLRISVPADWSILNTESAMFLHGPLPGGQDHEGMAHIQVSHPPAIAKDAAELFEKDLLLTKADAGGQVLKTDARPCATARLVEKRAIVKLSDGSGTFVNWTIDVLVPGEQARTSLYHLNFVGLSQAKYENHREFLERIVSSLEFDPALEARPK